LRFKLSILKEEENKKGKNKKFEKELNSYTQLKSFINFYSSTKRQSKSLAHSNRPKSLRFNSTNRVNNDKSKSPEKSKLKAMIGPTKNLLIRKLSIKDDNISESANKKHSSNQFLNEKKESKNEFKNLNQINSEKISNEVTGNNYNNFNTINQNTQGLKNTNIDEIANGTNGTNNNGLNSQTKVLPMNYRKNSVSILAGYEIKDIDSLMDFIERDSSKKIIDDDKEKENFNNIISNKYAYEVELEKYNNYIQKRPNSN